MGAWDIGPFDSDYALDWLGAMEDRMKQPGGCQPDSSVILADRLRDPLDDDYMGFFDAYATAGLVLAIVSETPQDGSTNLFARIREHRTGEREFNPDGLGLGRAMNYVELLTKDQALAMLPAAVEVLRAYAQSDWPEEWEDPTAMRQRLEQLTELGESYLREVSTG